MNWSPDYLPAAQTGIPQIDLDAPRVLAHSFLFDLDRHAESVAPDRFTRYMDDINIGVNSVADAKKIVRDLDLVLHARQVRLNSGKTNIFTAYEAYSFFRFADHRHLDNLQYLLEGSERGTVSHEIAAGAISRRLLKGYWRGDFDKGHGDKVLKRLLALSKNAGNNIPLRVLADILRRRPTCRDAAWAFVASRQATNRHIALVSDFAGSPEAIDDIVPLQTSSTLVAMQVKSKRGINANVIPLATNLQRGGPYRLYAALWILSKYGTEQQILNILTGSLDDWTANYELGRLVGGLFPRFYATTTFDQYRTLIQRSSSQSVGATYQFHSQLTNEPRMANALSRFLGSSNRSAPNGITHQKFLMILTALKSPRLDVAYKQFLIQKHRLAWIDIYYRELARKAAPASLKRVVSP